ncbi:hypothetical protein L3X38_002913 [Prunus dulcis]|uniref:Transposable element protein n=1 Tax=Prunus dulcis TaxID=3755 RepID=A0AAD4WYR8_PRUDU|nr:hypothetical protein L3X38_002913 [Prunus dulcis]
MKDLGPLHYFLGMEAVWTSTGLHLSQSKYILDLLTRTKMLDCKPLPTPVVGGCRLSLHDGDALSDVSEYRSVIGALQYLTFTRPNIAFFVNQVCQFMHKPATTHWAVVERILCYLKSTSDDGLVYKPSSLSLTTYADADYAGDLDDHRSTGGIEAEYRQLAYIVVALSLSRTRHIEVDYHYVREKVIHKELEVDYISSKDQLADLLIKVPLFGFVTYSPSFPFFVSRSASGGMMNLIQP